MGKWYCDPQQVPWTDWTDSDILEIARVSNAHVVWRKARCEHGKTRRQFCASCDAGYAYDTHAYACVSEMATDRSGEPLVAETDDIEWVVYIPARDQRKLIAHK